MRSSLTLLILAVGCVPPPPVGGGDSGAGGGGGDPSIEIVFPTPEMLVQLIEGHQVRVPIALNSNCELELIIAVDVDNIELVDPLETDGDVDGQGHWHLQMTVPERGYTAVSDQAATLTEDGLQVGALVNIAASLQSNGHEALDDFDDFDSDIEVTVGAPVDTGVVCP